MYKITLYSLIVLAVAVIGFQALGNDSFNCHNYAWESQRRWLDDPTPFIAAATECSATDATRVVYWCNGAPIHSGLYTGEGWVRSKWGSNPIVVHPLYASPYGFNVRFYR